MAHYLSLAYANMILLHLPHHPRISGRLKQLDTDMHTLSSPNDRQRTWKAYSSSLRTDCDFILSISNACSSTSTAVWCISYRMQDTSMTTASLVVACLAIITRCLASCADWHVGSLEEGPDTLVYWCEVTKRRGDSIFIQTTMLLAAPFAFAAWSSLFTLALLASAFHRLPMPICLDLDGSRFMLLCPSQETFVDATSPSAASQNVVIAVVAVGFVYVVAYAYYFTMLGVAVAPTDAESTPDVSSA